jgi:hypothetical protein
MTGPLRMSDGVPALTAHCTAILPSHRLCFSSRHRPSGCRLGAGDAKSSQRKHLAACTGCEPQVLNLGVKWQPLPTGCVPSIILHQADAA